MVTVRLIALLIVAVALPVAAGGAATVRRLVAPATVTALAFDGTRVAFASDRSTGDCDRVRLWNLRTGAVKRLGRTTPCVETSTGTGIASVAIAGARVLWLHYTGGNIREWSLFTATASAPRPRQLRFVARDVDAPAPIVLDDGDAGRFGDLLPYAVGTRVIVLDAKARRRLVWSAPRRVVALSARDDELAVAQQGGVVSVLDLAGRVVREEAFASELGAVELTGAGVLVQRGATLEYRNGGDVAWTAQLPPGSRLVDSAGATDAIYTVRGEVHARRVGGSRDVLLAHGTLAQVEGLTLAVARGRTLTARTPYRR